MYKPLAILLAAIAVSLSVQVKAQETFVGIYNSPKGIGATMEIAHSGMEFSSVTALVEMYGIPTGRCENPGVKLNYSKNFIYKSFDKESVHFQLYAGPGISAGYLRDFEVGERVDGNLTLTHNPGVMAALSGKAGCRFSFEGRIALDLSFSAELGLHARRDENVNNIDLKMYRNGLLQCIYPELSILVRL